MKGALQICERHLCAKFGTGLDGRVAKWPVSGGIWRIGTVELGKSENSSYGCCLCYLCTLAKTHHSNSSPWPVQNACNFCVTFLLPKSVVPHGAFKVFQVPQNGVCSPALFSRSSRFASFYFPHVMMLLPANSGAICCLDPSSRSTNDLPVGELRNYTPLPPPSFLYVVCANECSIGNWTFAFVAANEGLIFGGLFCCRGLRNFTLVNFPWEKSYVLFHFLWSLIPATNLRIKIAKTQLRLLSGLSFYGFWF